MALHAAASSIIAERICIRRELTGGLDGRGGLAGTAEEEEGMVPTRRTADIVGDGQDGRPTTHVLFDEEEDEQIVDGKAANGGAEAYEMKVRADKGSHND